MPLEREDFVPDREGVVRAEVACREKLSVRRQLHHLVSMVNGEKQGVGRQILPEAVRDHAALAEPEAPAVRVLDHAAAKSLSDRLSAEADARKRDPGLFRVPDPLQQRPDPGVRFISSGLASGDYIKPGFRVREIRELTLHRGVHLVLGVRHHGGEEVLIEIRVGRGIRGEQTLKPVRNQKMNDHDRFLFIGGEKKKCFASS